jgi:putative toxin-antitoxin system antitoxin component (TIGR02293 family)
MEKVKSKTTGTERKKVLSQKLASGGKSKLSTDRGAAVRSNAIVFSGTVNKPESQMTPIEKMERFSVGISKKELEILKKRTGLDYDKLAKLLSVTRATLINKSGDEKFNTALSERIFGLADIYSYGYDVFEDETKFNQWMFRQNKALGGKTPFEVCNNQFGREEVKNIIGRIEYGVYS